ncbi:ankyrin repeat-containing domain protein [Aspergillus cavernicola]|uniref:Ankyrin repeat-containing domain protein n=1 Tax=Aspergillus cavernicola TaxID=176166 RepID=A0ABR4IPR6_9EURO
MLPSGRTTGPLSPKFTKWQGDKQSSDAPEHWLSAAAYIGDFALVQLIVEQCVNVDGESDIFGTPLVNAAYGGHLTLVRFLLGKGADVNSGALQLTEIESREAERYMGRFIEKFLFLPGYRCPWIALGAAAVAGHEEIVKLLLEPDLKLSRSSHSFFHVITDAAEGGNLNVLRRIITCADLDALPQRVTRRALNNALKASACKDHLDSMRFLLDAGTPVDLSLYTVNDHSALWYAACNGQIAAIELL